MNTLQKTQSVWTELLSDKAKFRDEVIGGFRVTDKPVQVRALNLNECDSICLFEVDMDDCSKQGYYDPVNCEDGTQVCLTCVRNKMTVSDPGDYILVPGPGFTSMPRVAWREIGTQFL